MAVFRLLLFAPLAAGLAAGALAIGRHGAALVEEMVETRAATALAAVGAHWALLEADGTHLRLSGNAHDPFARELARETIARAVPFAVLADHSIAADPGPPPRPVTRIELVRDGARIVLSGFLPDEPSREALLAALALAAPGFGLTDLTETGSEGALLPPAAELAARIAASVSPARVVLGPGWLRGQGLAASEAARGDLFAGLVDAAGQELSLDLDIRVPAPVIEPFAVSLVRAPGGALRVEACAARNAEEAAALRALFRQHGLTDDNGQVCAVGLGGPPGDWVGAVAAGLGALAGIDRGRMTLRDRAALIDLPDPLPPDALDAVQAAVRAGMPPGYTARFSLAGAEPEETATPLPYWLSLSHQAEGVVLSGHVPQGGAAEALIALARARFAGRIVRAALTARENPSPEHWLESAFAGIEALALLPRGEARLTEERLTLEGEIADAVAAGQVHRDLNARLPWLVVSTALRIDLPALVAAVPPDPARCAVLLNRLMQASPVQFAPGSAVIEPAARPVLAEAAALLARCRQARIEIGGHTDSQGSSELNNRLSAARAEAVRDALLGLGVSLARLTARGYGDSQPVASNATEEGRAQNRRIAFRVLETDEP